MLTKEVQKMNCHSVKEIPCQISKSWSPRKNNNTKNKILETVQVFTDLKKILRSTEKQESANRTEKVL